MTVVGFLRTDAKGVRVVSLLREDIEIDRRRGGASCLTILYIYISFHMKSMDSLHQNTLNINLY